MCAYVLVGNQLLPDWRGVREDEGEEKNFGGQSIETERQLASQLF